MSIFVLTQSRQVHNEIVEFDKTNGAVLEGTWVKLTDKWNEFQAMDAGENALTTTICPTILNSERGDTTSAVYNPGYTAVALTSSITIIRNWDNLLIETDNIVSAETLSIGDQLTVVGGKLAKITLATQPVFGVFMGPSNSGKIIDGSVVQLTRQERELI